MRKGLLVLCLFLMVSTAVGQVVSIPDPNLRAKIEETLGKGSGATITAQEMATLTQLGARDANISNLTGLESATNLIYLDLNYNSITNISALSGLTKLEWLSLGSNSISDISVLSGLTYLETLYLGYNKISDISALSGLIHLEKLYLRNNSITNISALSGLTNLELLNLSDNPISNISVLSGLTNLESLSLGNNKISDISVLSGLTHLEYLYLAWNSITNISALSGLTNLEKLYLEGNKISDISVLSGLTHLEYLYLAWNSITNISALSGLTNLESLGLEGNNITNISALSGLTKLEVLNLRDTGGITNISVLSGLTKLTYLALGGNSITDISALSGLTKLEQLGLEGNNITNISALSGLTKLGEWLNLYNNSISDISPLVSNIGLGRGDTVDVRENPLSSASLQTHIPALQGRGITVEFTPDDHGSTRSGATQINANSTTEGELSRGDLDYFQVTINGSGTLTAYTTGGVDTAGFIEDSSGAILDSDDDSGANNNFRVSRSVSSGTYYIRVQGYEADYTGSYTLHVSSTASGGQAPNLVVEAEAEPSTVDPGQEFSLYSILRNSGTATAGATTVRYYRSTDASISTADTQLGTGSRSALAVNGTIRRRLTVTAPTTAGTYYYGVCVDSVPNESDTTDNCSTTVTVTVIVPSDVNNDGTVNISDLVFVALRYGQTGQNTADVNGDGTVDIDDLILVAAAIDEASAAPAVRAQTLNLLSVDEVEGWLTEAELSNDGSAVYLKGVMVLEQLLAMLTPKETALLPNYPNPFNPETWIPFHLAQDADVRLTIYDIEGEVVRELDLGHRVAGYYTDRAKAAYWDGRNGWGESVASGVYFYQLRVSSAGSIGVGDYAALRKMVILK